MHLFSSVEGTPLDVQRHQLGKVPCPHRYSASSYLLFPSPTVDWEGEGVGVGVGS